MPSLDDRTVTPELMDGDLSPRAHRRALAGLRRLNRAAGAGGAMARPVLALARGEGLEKITMLDIACGSGDVPSEIARRLMRNHISVELTLSDRSLGALEEAQLVAAKNLDSKRSVHIVRGSAPDELPGGECSYDILTNSLFLHHLSREDAVATLAGMARRARVGIVVSDLRRSLSGYILAWMMCRLLSRSAIVHFDGPVSVKAAWTMEEMREMVKEAGLEGAVVKGCWPMRMMITWRRMTKG